MFKSRRKKAHLKGKGLVTILKKIPWARCLLIQKGMLPLKTDLRRILRSQSDLKMDKMNEKIQIYQQKGMMKSFNEKVLQSPWI